MELSELLDALSDAECRKANANTDIATGEGLIAESLPFADHLAILAIIDKETDTRNKANTDVVDLAPQIREACNDLAKGPGRFEGAGGVAVYYNECSMMGDGELVATLHINDFSCVTFNVSAVNRIIWPELADVETVRLCVDSQGFISIE